MGEVVLPEVVRRLLEKGVRIPHPGSVEVDADVSPDRISGRGVVLHGGVRLRGAETLLCDGVVLGALGPAVVENCLLGPAAELAGGSFRGSVFLGGTTLGPAAQVREGCLLEEESSAAHAVGLKQTILFPFVTLGSLINFCDCLMAGGTSRRNHSEVGSSFIHFNYTPRQDKATPSLIGDVPRGVMLDQPPVFLGGQGGIAGPVRLGFGTVLPAGMICRRDVPDGGVILGDDAVARPDRPFEPDLPERNLDRKVRNNLLYLANLRALEAWYRGIRSRFFAGDALERALLPGALAVLAGAVAERIRRLGELAEKPRREDGADDADPKAAARRRQFRERWAEARGMLQEEGGPSGESDLRDRFLAVLDRRVGRPVASADYLPFIRSLDPPERRLGTAWLEGVVAGRMERVLGVLTAFRPDPDETT